MSDFGEPIRFAAEDDGSLVDRDGNEIWEEGDEPEFVTRARFRAKECINACRGIADPERVVPLLVEIVLAAERNTEDMRIWDMLGKAFGLLKPKTEGT